ncbi:Gibberellin 2-beta-dioxygenase 8 [Citrus sinensis]|uniref:Gibberellin 2-beta-dioxygenase 8 n=1 Tax=Citrus sinensis TaxID=2711 RepID=A0ACB8NYZ8_CITSI|nr:Gibberellin 2-beta-dioxygenase 8 [Citrus sinensis]KAH9803371.1 Gibberellin 2-beta-dioxygenase 8 [Citrus sinensis]
MVLISSMNVFLSVPRKLVHARSINFSFFISMDDIEPPFEKTYPTLFHNSTAKANDERLVAVDEECQLPSIDLARLNFRSFDKWIEEMAEAASQWGFFQVMNHGIPQKVLESMRKEQMKIFHQPFRKKSEQNFMNLSADSYRWGNPKATCLKQFLWSEALHIPVTDISRLGDESNNPRSTIGLFSTKAANLAERLAEYLARNLKIKSSYFRENCLPGSSYLRMNRYPPCPPSFEVLGLIPHTDSDFLTILYQDHVGGLQLKKDGRWLSVKPNPDVLIVNVGDLFQALSNGVYKSVEHRVVSHPKVERYSVAYFYCPSYEAVIESTENIIEPAIYRKFSFREYKQQIQEDVRATGNKVGLSRFLL